MQNLDGCYFCGKQFEDWSPTTYCYQCEGSGVDTYSMSSCFACGGTGTVIDNSELPACEECYNEFIEGDSDD